jgi:hypothetical protein
MLDLTLHARYYDFQSDMTDACGDMVVPASRCLPSSLHESIFLSSQYVLPLQNI